MNIVHQWMITLDSRVWNSILERMRFIMGFALNERLKFIQRMRKLRLLDKVMKLLSWLEANGTRQAVIAVNWCKYQSFGRSNRSNRTRPSSWENLKSSDGLVLVCKSWSTDQLRVWRERPNRRELIQRSATVWSVVQTYDSHYDSHHGSHCVLWSAGRFTSIAKISLLTIGLMPAR